MVVVMKFGGAALENAEKIRNVFSVVRQRLPEKPVVVVSAMKGVTDLLLGSFAEKANIAKIRHTHVQALKELDLDEKLLDQLFAELEKAVSVVSRIHDVNPKTRDFAASFGERLCARLVAAHFEKQGVKAKAFDAWDLGMVTDSNFGMAQPLPEAEKRIAESFAKIRGIDVPVITGYIGKDKAGEVTTLARGGTDYTASFVGAAIHAKQIEFWKEVNGIMSADPRIVPEARTIPRLSFDEMAELAFFGAKVLHPKTVEPAVRKNIPLLVKNVFDPGHPGTVISEKTDEREHAVKAISSKKGVSIINVKAAEMLSTYGFAAKVFSVMARNKISVDLIATSEINISFSVSNSERKDIENVVKELSAFATVIIENDRAIVSVVGKGIKGKPGLAGKVFTATAENGINVEIISQAAPEINLTFVVDGKDADNAVRALHKKFVEEN